jgi:hypothetical protein
MNLRSPKVATGPAAWRAACAATRPGGATMSSSSDTMTSPSAARMPALRAPAGAKPGRRNLRHSRCASPSGAGSGLPASSAAGQATTTTCSREAG